MKTIYLIITLVLTSALFCQTGLAQDYNKWDLPEGAITRFGKSGLQGVTFSPDGNRLVVVSSIGFWVYDVHTGKELDLLTGNMHSSDRIAFSLDGRIVAVISTDKENIRLWDTGTGQHLKTFTGHKIGIQSVCFSPDGNTLASGGVDGNIFLLDITTGQLQKTLTKHTDPVTSICFSPDGNVLASGGFDKAVHLWDASTGQHLKTLLGHTDGVTSICFSPNGTTLATVDSDEQIRLWSASTGQHLKTLLRHTDWRHKTWVNSMCFSLDSTILAVGGDDSNVYLWNAVTGKLQNTLISHTAAIESVCFSPDGTTLATISRYTVRLWSTTTGHLRNTLTGHTGIVNNVCFSPDGTTLAIGDSGGNVRLWNPSTGRLQNTLTKGTSVCFSPDGTTLATWYQGISLRSRNGPVHLWNAKTGQHLNTFTMDKFTGYSTSMCFSPDGSILATGILNGDYNFSQSRSISVLLRSTSTGRILKTLADTIGPDSYVNSVCFSPDGTKLASGGSNGNVHLWDAVTGAHKTILKGHEGITWCVTFRPDGAMLASGNSDKTVRLWNAITGQHLKTLIGHTKAVTTVCFSPDGTILASGGSDGTILLWDIAKGRSLRNFSGHTGSVKSVYFSPDGTTLASGSTDGTALLWDTSMFSAQPSSEFPPPGDETTLTSLTPQQIAKKALAATVLIVMEDRNGLPLGSGSGFFISPDMIVTNLHVVEKGNRATFKRVGKNRWRNVKKVIKIDTQQDLVILKVPDVGASVLPLGNSDTAEIGETVYAVGNPKGFLEGTFSPGLISGIRGKDSNRRIQITAPISPGSSGGPLLNRKGEVIGIVAGAIEEGQNLNFAIPSNYLRDLLSRVRGQK